MPTRARVLVLYNAPTVPPDHPDAESERAVVDNAEWVAGTLAKGGYDAQLLAIDSDPTPLLKVLKTNRPAAVFNLFEGPIQKGDAEAYAIGFLEWFEIPYTGCPFHAAVLARYKPRAKLLLQGAGLPTPPAYVVESLAEQPCPLTWPVIAKPAAEDASVGIDQGSVVTNQAQLSERLALLFERFGLPILVEEFIDGREFNVSLIEHPDLQLLPISEIVFSGQEAGLLPIVTYNAKWAVGSDEDLASTPCCPADISPALAEDLRDLAVRAYRLFGCRDYARVDFRVDRAGRPFILEVNPNPDFHASAGLARALDAAGISHCQFTVDLVRQAIARNGNVNRLPAEPSPRTSPCGSPVRLG